MQRYYIDLQLGVPYDLLHCTLVHWFCYEGDRHDLVAALDPVCSRGIGRVLFTEGRDYFGAEHDLLVTRIFWHNLRDPHWRACDAIEKIGGTFAAPHWVRDGYRAHVTERDGLCVPDGSYVVATRVRLFAGMEDGAGHVLVHAWPIGRNCRRP